MNYVARFATSSGRLEAYLARKLRERGWEEGEPGPDIPALVADFASRGYVDDEAYARTRSEGLLARGYGARRVGEALRQAGIDEN
ncbi:RecX family transcriptional regulator, partial [Aurantiacibacter xanthus]